MNTHDSTSSSSSSAAKPINDVAVYLDEAADLTGGPVLVGLLNTSYQGGRSLASASFQYDRGYLAREDRYEISPDLPLVETRTHTGANTNLFGAFSDASPDTWGQKLIEANNAVQRRNGVGTLRALGEFDYLIGVDDRSRMGAIRLAPIGDTAVADTAVEDSAPRRNWLSTSTGAGQQELFKILRIATRYEASQASDEDIEYLAGIATSPGGARPKTNLRLRSGRLALAKLPHSKDGNVDVEGWEAVTLTIAKRAGITTPQFRAIRATENKSILLLSRFDRFARDASGSRASSNEGGISEARRGYISAATAMGIGRHDDNSSLTYQHFADTIAALSGRPGKDLAEMYARIALSVLVNNVDDHWRNHGFVRLNNTWRLAPVFDVNPNPRRGVVFSRAIGPAYDPRQRDIRDLHETSKSYRLNPTQSAEIIARVAAQVRQWPTVAREAGIAETEILEMNGAFNEQQLEIAEALPRSVAPSAARTIVPAYGVDEVDEAAASDLDFEL